MCGIEAQFIELRLALWSPSIISRGGGCRWRAIELYVTRVGLRFFFNKATLLLRWCSDRRLFIQRQPAAFNGVLAVNQYRPDTQAAGRTLKNIFPIFSFGESGMATALGSRSLSITISHMQRIHTRRDKWRVIN
jgi:hypothetical protein